MVLGVSPAINTRKNPLDFEARKQMILADYPHITVLYVKDVFDDAVWSKSLDSVIGDVMGPGQTVVLYGGRDSFTRAYSGRYPTQELIQAGHTSGTDVRKQLSRSVIASSDFRAGVIWASHNRFPICYPTVDCVVFTPDWQQVLLGRKDGERQFRVIGGFAEPSTTSYENDAAREVMEEANVIVSKPEYVTSLKVDDWRYRGTQDSIKTLVFVATIGSMNEPEAADDIVEVKFFDAATLDIEEDIMPLHRPMVKAVLEYTLDRRKRNAGQPDPQD